MFTYNGGWIEMIVGPMFSSKTEELIRRIKRANIAGLNTAVVKPKLDTRYENEKIVSHDGKKIQSYTLKSLKELAKFIEKHNEIDVLGIDEIQFFPKTEKEGEFDIIQILTQASYYKKRIIATGLDMDFRGEPFGFIPELMSIAEKVDKLHAICNKCGSLATRTQRIVDEKPAYYSDPIILIGADEYYEARCKKHHIIRYKSKKGKKKKEKDD